MRESRAERGIILCGSGVGASMAANRIPGIRAGLCHDTYSAHQGVEHDDMNVLVLGGRVIGVELARELIHAFLNARFTGEERHLRRLAKVTALENRLRALQVFGQSVWLDYIRRSLITSGELRRLIDEDGLRGVTSNPAIFEKAIAGSSDYTEILEAPEARTLDAKALYEKLAIRDIQDAADALRPVYEQTARRDGYVSLEVSPLLAHDTAGTLDEARRLWQAVGRDNLMIKVPATAEGIPAIQQLIGEGINVNVTLLFAQETYEQVADAYIAGLETLVARGGDLKQRRQRGQLLRQPHRHRDRCAHRDTRCRQRPNAREQGLLRSLTGKVAIANAKLTYQRYQELFSGPRWQALAEPGRADAAPAVGQHRHEESQLSRRPLRRGADRARHGQHDSARDLRRVSRSRAAARQPHGRRRRRPRHDGSAGRRRHLDEGRRPTGCSPRACSCSPTPSTSCSNAVEKQSKEARARERSTA